MFRRSSGQPPEEHLLAGSRLVRSRGRWRGELNLDPFGLVPVSVPGARSEPDPAALALACSIPQEAERCAGAIEAALAEHRLPYRGDESSAPGTDEARVSYASVIKLDGELVIELGYQVGWDDDHTLGARLRDGRLIELNGSVVEP